MRRLVLAVLAAAGCLAAAQAAMASTLALQGGTTVQFTAGAGETNDLTVTRSATLYTVTDPGSAIAPTAPCAAVNANTATCPVAGVTGVSLLLGDGNDRAAIDAPVTLAGVTIEGADGNDTLSGSAGDDSLSGGDGADILDGGAGDDALSGGPGADSIQGGAGDDTLAGQLDAQPDVMNGGAGTDLADYSATGVAVSVNLDGVANDGPAGEGDDAGVDIEDVTGSGKADTLTGSAGANELDGGGGNDTLNGMGGADGLNGGRGSDTLDGGAGIDALAGGAGADRLRGRDISRDDVACGGGVDTAVLDTLDEPRACEIASRGVAVASAFTRPGRTTALIRLTCPAIEAVPCVGTLTLRSGTNRVGGRIFSLTSGATAALPVRLNARGRRARSLGATTIFRDALGVGVINRRTVALR